MKNTDFSKMLSEFFLLIWTNLISETYNPGIKS